MACYIYFYQQIASRTSICARFTFITDTDTLTIVNTSWNRYLNFFAIGNVAGTTAIRTFILTAAESRIRDVDVAEEMMNLSKLNLINQAAQAMMSQAKSQPEGVMQLLR